MSAAGTVSATAATAAPSGVAATARGGWWGFLGSTVNAVFGYLVVTLVTRALGAHGSGAVFTCVAVFTILSNTCKLGADTGLVRFVSRDVAVDGGRGVGALVRSAVVPGAAASTAAAVLLLLSPSAATSLLPSLPPDKAVALIRLFALFLPAATVTLILLGATQGYGTVVPFVGVEQVLKPVLRLLIAVPVALLAPGVLSLAAAWLVPMPAGVVIAWFALRRYRRTNPRRNQGPGSVSGTDALATGAPATEAVGRGFWAFAAPRALSSLFDISSVWVGVILLSCLATSEDAGVYTAVSRVILAATLLQHAVHLAFAPEGSRLLAVHKTLQACRLHRISTRWIVLFSWPLFVLLASFPHTVLSLFGPEFTRGADALVVLCVASAINVGVGNAQTVLLMAGKSSWHLGATAVAFAVQLTVGILAVPRSGLLGAALSWGAAIVVENLLAAALVRHHPGFTTVDRGYLAAAGVSLFLMVGLVIPARFLAGDTAIGLAAGIVLAIGVLGVSLHRFPATLGVRELIGAFPGQAS